MSGTIDVPDAVQWHEGMMLAPQHFQQQALRHERALQYHLMIGIPYHWGVVRLQIDRVALVSGMLRILNIEAVMPDGTIVSQPEYGADLDLDLTPLAGAAADAAVTIHLAMPAAKPSGLAAPGDLPRHRSVEGVAVSDEATGEGEIRIPRLRPRLSLLYTIGPTQKPPQKYTTLPIAELVFQSDAFVLTDYIVPSLSVTEDGTLGRLCSDLARRVREKALFLMEQLGSQDGAATLSMRDTQAEVRGLVAGLPPLEALLSSGTAHPFAVYMALCGMVGNMAASGVTTLPPVLSRYDHDNVRPIFAEIRTYITRSLDRVREQVVTISFQFENDKFSLVMQPAWLERPLVVAVRASVSMTEADVVSWIRTSLVASRSKVETLWEMRVMGAARRILDNPSALGIARGRGVVLIEIESDGAFIRPGEPLDIWNTNGRAGQRRPLEILLYLGVGDTPSPRPATTVGAGDEA